jgi:TrmH family RNA methyltransferase
MREVKIKKYLKKLDYSYALGFHPVIALLKMKPTRVIKVLLQKKSDDYKEADLIKFLCQKNGIRLEYNQGWIKKISSKKNTYAVGIFEKYQEELIEINNHIILVNPSDMGNLGTIIRSMSAFDFSDLALIEPAADIFDPKVVSTTTGSLFKIRFSHYESLEEYREKFEFHNFYLFTLNGKKSLKSIRFEKPYCLVFGHETRGIDPKYENWGKTIKIKQSQDVDSLNLAISASLAMYQAYK